MITSFNSLHSLIRGYWILRIEMNERQEKNPNSFIILCEKKPRFFIIIIRVEKIIHKHRRREMETDQKILSD